MSAYDTKGQPAHSAADCARLCLQDTSCAASTWQSSRSRCYRTARPAAGSPDPVAEVNEDDGRGYVALQPLGEAANDHDRLDQVCQSRVDAALAPVQDRVRQCDSFIEGNYTLLDHTNKDINNIPIGQAETVIAGGAIWKTYYFQAGGGGASMDYTDQISTVPECLKWCVQRAADGCVRADLSPDAPQCRLYNGWNTATPGRGSQRAMGTHSSVFVAKA
ncbi:hypothetical protein BO86DRAFT_404171 [Aspergillus japonicus CBS 114.51]|uniref:Apple domain-containing protein n=1 Tax=Aspergillus japonicus CBS 114.51 TaxID=1448312 RepID=A0A8T8WMR9_ASPJA|nr:hypothetical protein BO86DRAFT_404171 [Aspergillus japonicus CBS 114.51]RAH76932.1 hypothetical protein BO86DRAFT_404171 [Aspergillus japonicus CBS 114.51]